MNKEHYHPLRKVAGRLYCTDPLCSKKFTLEEMHGKLVKCLTCKSHFIFDREKYSPEDYKITCNHCDKKGPWELTLEVQKMMLAEIATRNITEQFKSNQEILDRRSKYLDNMAAEIRGEQLKLDMRITKFKRKEDDLQARRIAFAKYIKEARVSLKAKPEPKPNKDTMKSIESILDKAGVFDNL